MSKVPRWGALTFNEKVENDMVLNRMKDIYAPPHKTDFIKLNIKKTFDKSKHSTIDEVRETEGENAMTLLASSNRRTASSPESLNTLAYTSKEKVEAEALNERDSLI